jgi:CHAT domain-containing protein
LPADTVVLAYAVLPEKTLAWAVQRGSTHAILLDVGSRKLEPMVGKLRDGLAARRDMSRLSSTLYQTLLSPLLKWVPAGSRLVILPDKCLGTLPFAALRASQTGHYLFEDYALSIAPSATVLINSLRHDGELWRTPETKLLIVGDPAAPGMAALPEARIEMASVGRMYAGSSTQLSGSLATKAAFLAALPQYDIVHFAGHALIDPDSPQRSRLVFAGPGGPSGPGALMMNELFGRPLPRTRLVVLSGCATGAGQLSATEGPLSLARPFLSDGAPAVVASLWNVDDAVAAKFFSLFYERLHSGTDAVEALRSAQLALLNSRDANQRNPQGWAAFEVFGGVKSRYFP